MRKMMNTLASVARSLEITRDSVPMAGAWAPSLRTQRMQKMGAASLSAWTVPTVIAKAGTIASRPIRPWAENAQRRRAAPSVMPA